MNFKHALVVVLILLSINVFAQSEQIQITLLDLETALPIEQTTFEYGSQKGVSDENGVIRFLFQENEIMTLSNLNYGVWSINTDALLIAIKNGAYYRKSLSMNLYPVTIIGVKKQNEHPDATVNIQYSDRMEHDGAEILNKLPAFNSIRKGGSYGFDPVFRGFKYDQLNIVLNGAQSATAACPNRMDPPTSQMAPNMLDKIEVLKGPYALRYGTGFGATINFIPTKLRFTSNLDVYGRLSSGYETNGNIIREESKIGFSGKNHDISLLGSWSEGDDYKAGNGSKVQSDFQRGSFGADLGFKMTSNQQIRVSALYNRARNVDFAALPMDLIEDDTWLFNARHDIIINKEHLKSWNTTLFGSFVDHLMNNLLKPLNPRMLNAETPAKTYNFGGRTEGVWRSNKSILYAGADMRIEGAEGSRIREFLMGPNMGKIFTDNAWQDSKISKTGVFAEYQNRGTSLDYILSGRLEVNDATINDPSPEFTNVFSETNVTQINPSLSFGILKNFSKKFNTGLWFGRAQRSGGLTERFINFFPIGQDPYEMIGNIDLNPEVNNQVDITFQWTPSNQTSINVDVFGSYLQDYISSIIDPSLSPRLPSSPGVRRFINIDNAFKTGFEISWSQKLFVGLQHQLGIAYTYAQDLERDEPLPEIAPFDLRYALSGSYADNKLFLELIFRYVSEQPRISSEFGETASPSFALLDYKIGYKISKKLTANTGINNILDTNYFEHLNRSARGSNDPVFAVGRNIFLNLNYSF